MEIVVGLLAIKEWDINAMDNTGRTALAWAAVGGHEDAVKILLQCEDVKTDTTDTKCGRTPLSLAAGNGHSGAVKLQLEREDINTNTADTKYGRTLLLWAAVRRHSGVVKLLMEREDSGIGRETIW